MSDLLEAQFVRALNRIVEQEQEIERLEAQLTKISKLTEKGGINTMYFCSHSGYEAVMKQIKAALEVEKHMSNAFAGEENAE